MICPMSIKNEICPCDLTLWAIDKWWTSVYGVGIMIYSHNNFLLINAYSIHTVLSSVKGRRKLITCEEMNYMLSFNGITYLENGYELFLLPF